MNIRPNTVMASVIAQRIRDLIEQNGDMPILFLDPMTGKPLPMDPEAIEVNGGCIELWPRD